MLSDDSLIDFMEQNIHVLNERLEHRGYQITSEVGKLGNDNKRPEAEGSMPVTKPEGTLIQKTGFDCFA